MRLSLKRLLKEELSRTKEDVPKWMDSVLSVLNSTIEQVGIALQNRLTFEDNINCSVITREFTHGVELEINPLAGKASSLRASGVLLLSSGGLIVDKFGWVLKTSGNVGVTVYFDGGTSSTKATCKVAVLLN